MTEPSSRSACKLLSVSQPSWPLYCFRRRKGAVVDDLRTKWRVRVAARDRATLYASARKPAVIAEANLITSAREGVAPTTTILQ